LAPSLCNLVVTVLPTKVGKQIELNASVKEETCFKTGITLEPAHLPAFDSLSQARTSPEQRSAPCADSTSLFAPSLRMMIAKGKNVRYDSITPVVSTMLHSHHGALVCRPAAANAPVLAAVGRLLLLPGTISQAHTQAVSPGAQGPSSVPAPGVLPEAQHDAAGSAAELSIRGVLDGLLQKQAAAGGQQLPGVVGQEVGQLADVFEKLVGCARIPDAFHDLAGHEPACSTQHYSRTAAAAARATTGSCNGSGTAAVFSMSCTSARLCTGSHGEPAYL
jgi:hypothetical protein